MKFTAKNFPIRTPLALLIKAGWRLGRGFRIAEHRVMGSGLLAVGSREETLSV